MRGLFLLIALLSVSAPALAKPLSADISNTHIELHASFSGTDILLFGARNEPGDILIVVRGPVSNVTVREKQRIAGMWMYARKAKYNDLPQFVAIASTEALKRIDTPDIVRQLKLNNDTIIRNSAASPSTDIHFHEALLRIKERSRLYSTVPATISFFGETLFKTRIHFPDTMPKGTYQIEIYLIQDGRMIASQVMPLYAIKTGFEAWISDMAAHRPFLYGVISVALALVCGWFAHRIFRRR